MKANNDETWLTYFIAAASAGASALTVTFL